MTSRGSSSGSHRPMPLGELLKRDVNEKVEKPDVLFGQATQSKKGEDFTFIETDCQRVTGDADTSFSVFTLLDGHNGTAAAKYCIENLLNNILIAIPAGLNRDEWLEALRRAMVAGFVKTDKDLREEVRSSGTTVTLVLIDGRIITVGSVGDSQCILGSAEGPIYILSPEHRLDSNKEEEKRVRACGGEVGKLQTGGGTEVGPLRCWPGGLCLSRSVGDMDVGEFIVPIPHVKQVKLSSAGGRIIISSDGVWDALTSEVALTCSHGLPPDAAATQIVKEAVQVEGLKDDTTCIVVDILPREKTSPSPLPTQKKQGIAVFKSMFHKKSSDSSSHSCLEHDEQLEVEEIFEEGSAILAKRFETDYPLCNMFKLFVCAICQVELSPGEGISIHDSAEQNGRSRPWNGPFLCPSCHAKKEAMEGNNRNGARRKHRGHE